MPGICGIVTTNDKHSLRERLESILALMRHEDWYIESRHFDASSGIAMGRMSLGFVNTAPQPARIENGQLLAVMDGELYDAASLRADLRSAGCPVTGESHAELLLHGYRLQGQAFFRNLHGSFTAAIWDQTAGRLILTADRFGLRPLYYAHPKGKLLFGSSIQALLLDEEISTAANPRGMAQFFSFGQYLCEDTSLADVQIAPGAAWITYDSMDDRLSVGSYMYLTDELSDCSIATADQSRQLAAVETAFAAAVARRQQGGNSLGLALSGGLDARMILAYLDHPEQIKTISYGINGSLDHRCAARLSELVGCENVNYVLGADFLANYEQHLERMIQLTDGQYLSQGIILPTLPLYRRLGVEVLLRGHAGELMHMHKAYAYSLDENALAIRDDKELEQWLMTHLQGYMLSAIDGELFRNQSMAETRELALDSLHEALRPCEAVLSPVQRIWYLFVTQRLRRETSLSLAKFGSAAEIRVPYLDNDLVRLLLTLPPDLKLGETIQQFLIAQRKPEFLSVVNSNTGTKIGASSLIRKLSTLRMRILAKLGVPGYQPYERLGLWLRRELLPLVENTLLSEDSLDQGMFRPETLRKIIKQHTATKRNHTYLIMALLIHTLGQRKLNQRSKSYATHPRSGSPI